MTLLKCSIRLSVSIIAASWKRNIWKYKGKIAMTAKNSSKSINNFLVVYLLPFLWVIFGTIWWNLPLNLKLNLKKTITRSHGMDLFGNFYILWFLWFTWLSKFLKVTRIQVCSCARKYNMCNNWLFKHESVKSQCFLCIAQNGNLCCNWELSKY